MEMKGAIWYNNFSTNVKKSEQRATGHRPEHREGVRPAGKARTAIEEE